VRWIRYNGARIEAAGHRTSVELPPRARFGPTRRRYGYVWNRGESFCAYVELLRPGQTEDLDLGSFRTDQDARRAVEAKLMDPSAQSDNG